MKRVLAVALAVVMLMTIIPFAAFAQNGPMPDQTDGDEVYSLAWIRGVEQDAEFAFFANNTVNNNAYPGISYNKQTNTLTLTNVDAPQLTISANVMGDDFKIAVNGTCALSRITIWGDGYGGNLTFTGNGTLTVNEETMYDYAILMHAEGTPGQLVFGEDVKVTLYGEEGAVLTDGSILTDSAQLYVCQNGQTVNNILEQKKTYEEDEIIGGIYCYDAEAKEEGIKLATCANDPTGIYGVTTGYRDNPNQTLYWVAKYVYLEKFNAYIKDYSYFENDPRNHYGELEFTEQEWNAQTDYVLQGVPGKEPEKVKFRKVTDLDDPGDWDWSENRVTRASDPSGLYGYSTFTEEDAQLGKREGVNIHHFIYDNGTKRNVLDPSFAEITMYRDEFENSEWSIVYDTEYTELSWQGAYSYNSYMNVYEDTTGKKYASDWDNNYYTFTEGQGVNFGGEFCYYLTPAESVDASTLTPCVKTVTAGTEFVLADTPFRYVGNEQATHTHVWKKSGVIKPAAYSVGYTLYRCSCGKILAADFTNPTGKLTAFRCRARTANAISVTWDLLKGVPITGYQVQISNANGSAWSTVKVSKTNLVAFSGLNAGTNYKLRARFFIKAADGKNYFSPWVMITTPTLPTGTAITKLTPAKRAFTAQWKKNAAVNGYQLQYSLKTNFAGAKTVTVKNAKTLKAAVAKLAAGKVYCVRIRTYKTIARVNYFSAWSKTYKVKTK